MTTYYVATLAKYVLVNAANEAEAIVKGRSAPRDLYADLRERLGREVPIEVRTVRPATDDEIDDDKWFQEKLRQEAERLERQGASK